MSAAKTGVRSRKPGAGKVRACVRCGCTKRNACASGCAWVAESNVCTACLTPAEQRLQLALDRQFAAAIRCKLEAETTYAMAKLAFVDLGRLLEAAGQSQIGNRKSKMEKGGGK